MKHPYNIVAEVREHGAIGLFYRGQTTVEAESATEAHKTAFDQLTPTHEILGIDVYRDGQKVNHEIQ